MEGPINFTNEDKKQVFLFFESLLINVQGPMYYEYIRGHVSKASLIVRKYVALKCKGEKLLEYFKLRKNYFIVDGTSVQLIKNRCLGRKRCQSECTSEEGRGRNKVRKNDKEKAKRSISLSSPKEREHEDYVNKYFNDLVSRCGSVPLCSLDYDELPKKVKRHLEKYYKKTVANYFAHFPDKYCFDKEGKVSFKIYVSSETLNDSSPIDSTIADKVNSNSAANSSDVNSSKKTPPTIDPEIKAKYNRIEAMLFFVQILIKKRTFLTVDQLGGYLSQAPKELREFLKFNFRMLKHFFEDNPLLFSLSCEEVTLTESLRNSQLIVEKIKRVMSRGTITLETRLSKVDSILQLIKVAKKKSSAEVDNSCNHEEISLIKPNAEEQSNSPVVNASTQSSSCKDIELQIESINDKTGTEVCVNRPNCGNANTLLNTAKHAENYAMQMGIDYETESENLSIKTPRVDNVLELKDEDNGNSAAQPCSFLQSTRTFLEFFPTFQLFCLEITESDLEFTANNEVKAIQYFIEILDQPHLKNWSVKSLQGTIGKAPTEVSSFINRKYKGDKFVSFFEAQPEFKVDVWSFVKLAPSYQEIYSKRLNALSVSVNQNSKWDLLKLYKTSTYEEVFTQVAAFLYEICRFLQNKSKTKLSRLAGILTSSRKTLEWIKGLDGESLTKKIGNFLKQFSIFELFDGDFVYFEENTFNCTIMILLEKIVETKIDSVSLITALKEFINLNVDNIELNTKSFDLSVEFNHLLHEAINNSMQFKYCEIVKTLPNDVLLKTYVSNIGSGVIIEDILKSGEYFLQNGNIYFKKERDNVSNNCIDNSFISTKASEESNNQKIELEENNNPPTLDSMKEIKIDSIEKDLQISKSNEIESQTDSIFLGKSYSEGSSNEDFDSVVEDTNSLTDLENRYSFSSFDDEGLNESFDNISTLIENESTTEISSEVYDGSCVTESTPPEDIKLENNAVTAVIEQYIDILNEDDDIDNENTEDHQHESTSNALKENELCDEEITSDLLNNDETKRDCFKIANTDFKLNEHQMENISQMKFKAELLAKEVFHHINQSKLFVADTSVIFIFKKNYLFKTYGPLKSNLEVSRDSNETVNLVDNKMQNSPDTKISFNNVKLIKCENSHKNDMVNQDKSFECSLQVECSSANNPHTNTSFDKDHLLKCNFPNEVGSKNNFDSNDNITSDYPLQPILAEVVLITSDSCIAVATINSRKQNIYFLKCVFVCDHQYCCSDCFIDLKVSDTVSCFVPPTEISRKMWIAFMVSKENSTHFDEIDSFNEVIKKQNEGCRMNRNMCVNSKSISVQTVTSSAEFGCQAVSSTAEQCSQTSLSGEVKMCAITEDSACQTKVPVKCASIQTENETMSSGIQTDSSFFNKDTETQTNYFECMKESVICQTENSGLSLNLVNTESQTISTGLVMITKYYHM